MKDDEKYSAIERMVQHTEAYMRKQIERELTLDGVQRRLYQLTDVLYLTLILASFPVCWYAINKAIPERGRLRLEQLEQREEPREKASMNSSHVSLNHALRL